MSITRFALIRQPYRFPTGTGAKNTRGWRSSRLGFGPDVSDEDKLIVVDIDSLQSAAQADYADQLSAISTTFGFRRR
jgi:hypothetical protein